MNSFFQYLEQLYMSETIYMEAARKNTASLLDKSCFDSHSKSQLLDSYFTKDTFANQYPIMHNFTTSRETTLIGSRYIKRFRNGIYDALLFYIRFITLLFCYYRRNLSTVNEITMKSP